MKTEKAFIVEANSGVYVGHAFWPSDDHRRFTNFYKCSNTKAAEQLIEVLEKNITEAR